MTRVANLITQQGLPHFLKSMLPGSSEICIAVAFWGTGAIEMLGLDALPNAKILCNLPSGACNPNVIRPLWKRLDVKSHAQLHAKVYWTPTIAVVGSSNASTNGLVPPDDDITGWREANIVVEDKETLAELKRWFDRLWAVSDEIDEALLAKATAQWVPRRAQSRVAFANKASLMEMALKDPSVFKDAPIYLGFYNDDLTPVVKEHRDRARTEGKNVSIGGRNYRMKDLDYYQYWEVTQDSWIINFDRQDPTRPYVRSVTYVPDAPSFKLDGDKIITCYAQRTISLDGQHLSLTKEDRDLIAKHGLELQFHADDEGSMHISVAASLINSWRSRRNTLTVFPCPDSLAANLKYRIYYEPEDRPIKTGRFIGIYDKKAVRFIGEVQATASARHGLGHKLVTLDYQLGIPPKDFKRRIERTIETVKDVHDLRREYSRYYLMGPLHETQFVKSSKHGVRRPRVFDLPTILGMPENELEAKTAEEIAYLLNGKEFT